MRLCSTLFTALMALALAGPAFASPAVYQYRIEHPRYGDIGTYTNTIDEAGDQTHVTTELHVAVRVLGIVVFRQDASRSEEWRAGNMVAFHGVTETNGKRVEVDGERQGDRFAITSPAGIVTVPPNVHPSNPWSLGVLKSNLMMSTNSGNVSAVTVTGGEEKSVTFDGVARRVREYVIDGLKRDVVWLDDAGRVVGFRSEQRGTPVDFVLAQSSTGGQVATAPAP